MDQSQISPRSAISIEHMIEALKDKRPIFHSEADFPACASVGDSPGTSDCIHSA
jgi:hypothetical protein